MALPVEISNFYALIFGIWAMLPLMVQRLLFMAIAFPALISLLIKLCMGGE